MKQVTILLYKNDMTIKSYNIIYNLGENNQFLFDNLQADEEEAKAKSNSQSQNQYNYMLGNLMKKIDQPNKEYAR